MVDVRPEIRISDDDRQAMNERLAHAYAEGRIGIEELEERLAWVHRSTTPTELAEVARDLPPRTRPPHPPAVAPRFRLLPLLPAWTRGPASLLDLLVLLVTPVLILGLLVAINTGVFIWPAWLWLLCLAPLAAWVAAPSARWR